MDLGGKNVSFEEGFDFVIEDATEDLGGQRGASFKSRNSFRYDRPQGHQYMFES